MDRIENAQMNSLGTRKLYYEDVHQTDFTAVVMECVPDKEEGYYRIVLDASAFFPEEGGQSADKGTLNGQEVMLELKVAESDMGKVIGKQGRIAKAIRSVVKAAAAKENSKVVLDIE